MVWWCHVSGSHDVPGDAAPCLVTIWAPGDQPRHNGGVNKSCYQNIQNTMNNTYYMKHNVLLCCIMVVKKPDASFISIQTCLWAAKKQTLNYYWSYDLSLSSEAIFSILVASKMWSNWENMIVKPFNELLRSPESCFQRNSFQKMHQFQRFPDDNSWNSWW